MLLNGPSLNRNNEILKRLANSAFEMRLLGLDRGTDSMGIRRLFAITNILMQSYTKNEKYSHRNLIKGAHHQKI